MMSLEYFCNSHLWFAVEFRRSDWRVAPVRQGGGTLGLHPGAVAPYMQIDGRKECDPVPLDTIVEQQFDDNVRE